jgi:hypothetical protein
LSVFSSCESSNIFVALLAACPPRCQKSQHQPAIDYLVEGGPHELLALGIGEFAVAIGQGKLGFHSAASTGSPLTLAATGRGDFDCWPNAGVNTNVARDIIPISAVTQRRKRRRAAGEKVSRFAGFAI